MSDKLENKVEPVWKYSELLRKHEKETEVKFKNIDKKISTEIDKLTKLVDVTSSRYEKRFDLHLCNQAKLVSDLTQAHTTITSDYMKRISALDTEFNTKMSQFSCKLAELNASVHKVKLYFDLQPNSDLLVRFYDSDGALQRVKIKQHDPDNDTLVLRNDKVSLKYTPDETTFKFIGSKFYPTALVREDGTTLCGDEITTLLTNNLQKVSIAVDKVDAAVSKLENMNGYATSNDFKTATPTSEQLTKFAISCLTTSSFTATPEHIPNGTKIKNTHDNHVWILNRICRDGLTSIKWEDFGADIVNIANNNGTCGVVTGSQDKYRAFVDVNGVISINSLEETLDTILKSIELLQKDLEQFKTDVSAKLNDSK